MAAHLSISVLAFLHQCTHRQLKQVHAFIISTALDKLPEVRLKFLRRSTEFGDMEYPSLIFAHSTNAQTALWNAMIRGYAYNGPRHNALKLFDEMSLRGIDPNNFTYPYVLNSCSRMGLSGVGRKVHGRIIKSGFGRAFSVGDALFDFYVESGCLGNARKVFDEMPWKTVELWNKLIGKYANAGDVKNAREVFDEMPERDVISWNTIISAYAKVGDVALASELSERMPEKNVVTWTTLLGAYAGIGDLKTARKVFDEMPDRNAVSWNCMMSSYNRKGEYQKALDLFVRMQIESVQPDSFTFVAALTACSSLSDLESGMWVHYLIKDWPKMGVIVGTVLVEMYANCGRIDNAFTTFIKIGHKDVFCYNVMIKSLAIHGKAKEAIKIFHLMQKRGLESNEHTYSSAIFACSHGGLVHEGREIFKALERSTSVSPKPEHYCTMVDLLCRNDQIEEAKSLIEGMRVEPDIAIWGALLKGCQERGNLELAESIISKAVELKTDEAGVHVLLANIHASMGQWPEALQARKRMEEIGIWKSTGSSSCIV